MATRPTTTRQPPSSPPRPLRGSRGGALTIGYSRAGATSNPLGALDRNGPSTDAIFGSAVDALRGVSGPCRSAASTEATGGYTAYSDPLPNATTYVGLGYVTVNYTLAGAPTAELNARVFDVPPGAEGQPDKQLLMTRGTYRIDTPAYDTTAGTIKLPLYGNPWPLAPGHKIRLDLTQVDQPTYRPSNLPSAITFSGPTLTLPTRSSGDRTLGGQVAGRPERALPESSVSGTPATCRSAMPTSRDHRSPSGDR